MTLFHQQLDPVHAPLRHAVGKLLDGDGFRNRDLADEFFFRFVGRVSLQPLHAATKCRHRSLALFIGAECSDHREAAAIFLPRAACRLRCRRRSRRARTAPCARDLFLVGLERRPCAGPSRRYGVLAETFLRLLLGLELGFELVLATPLFVGFARFGGLALSPLGGFTQGADKSFLLRNLAPFRFATPSCFWSVFSFVSAIPIPILQALAVVHHVSMSDSGRSPDATCSDREPVGKRSRRETRARNVSLSGPASRAACITFDRPNAKSNCTEVNVSITRISTTTARQCSAPASYRVPSVRPPPA